MTGYLMAAAISWHAGPLDTAWAKLAADAAAHDAVAFAADRELIGRLSGDLLLQWGARTREAYHADGIAFVTYSGPTQVRGERAGSAYFAVMVPAGDFLPPTYWEVTPGFSPHGGVDWNLRVSGCELRTGDPVSAYPRQWRTPTLDAPPSYDDFKAMLAAAIRNRGEYLSYTATAHTPGTLCLYVGDLTTERLRVAPASAKSPTPSPPTGRRP